MLDFLRTAVNCASNTVWGPWTLVLLLGTGLFLSIRFRFAQLTTTPFTQPQGAAG